MKRWLKKVFLDILALHARQLPLDIFLLHPNHSPGAQRDFSLSSSSMQESTHFSSFLQTNKSNVIVLVR